MAPTWTRRGEKSAAWSIARLAQRAMRRSAKGWAEIATAAAWEMQPRTLAGGRVPQHPSQRCEKARGQRAMRRSAQAG